MTWQQPGEPAAGGAGREPDPSLEETRADWPLPEPGPADPTAEPAAPPAAPGAPPPPPGLPPATPPVLPSPPAAGSYPAAGGTPPAGTWAPPGGYGGGAYPGDGYAAPSLQYASTPTRFVAFLVDGFILAVISWGVGLVLAMVGLNAYDFTWATSTGSLSDLESFATVNTAAVIVHAALAAAISAAYFILQWSSGARATLGMRLFSLQLGNATDGRTLTRSQAARRWLALDGWASLAGMVPGLGLLVSLPLLLWELVLLITVVNSPTRQGVHDRFAGSAMVQPPGGSGNGLVIGCLLIVGLLVAIAVLSFIALIFLGSQVSTILSTVGESI